MINVRDDLSSYRAQLKELHHLLERSCGKETTALSLLGIYTNAIDALLTNLWQKYQVDSTQYCLLAVGGYGRMELYPYSDLDILVLSNKPTQEDTALESFLHALWDLKLKTAPVTATLEQLNTLCSENLQTLTSILDQRYLCGSPSLYQNFCQQKVKLLHLSVLEFYQQKKQEQQQRHQRFGSYALSLEPNIKESPGGLRDLQTLLWCFKYAMIKNAKSINEPKKNVLLSELNILLRNHILHKEEAQKLSTAYLYLAHIRFALHLLSKKSIDKLSFEAQTALATDYVSEETSSQRIFMKFYYETILTLQRYTLLLEKIFLSYLDNLGPQNPKFTRLQDIEKRVLEILIDCPNKEAIQHIPLEFIRQLYTATLMKKQASENNVQALFLNLFNKAPNIYTCLKALHVWGLLPYYLPEFQDCIGLIQHSLFHSYTVDEHTLLLTAMLDKFHQPEYQEQYPLCHDIIFKVQSLQVLYLAALLHDSGKGRTEDHSLVGKQLATTASLRLASLLNPEEQNNLIWLVEDHLLMSHVAQKQDIHDPEIVIAFAKKVKNYGKFC
ncbi:MAG: hypothetical protein K2Q33_08765 [Gammaproteobacteria bacterium]|nr:hypothetical protein [Gammaproteobacteria bacterium]